MRRLIVCVFALFAAVTGRADLLVNGDFEATGWTTVRGGEPQTFVFWDDIISDTGWTGEQPNPWYNAAIVVGVNGGLNPYDGDQAFSFNYGRDLGSYIWARFATVAGQEYRVTFHLGRTGVYDGVLAAAVAINYNYKEPITEGLFVAGDTVGWSTYTINFTAVDAVSYVRFSDRSASNPHSDLELDSVSYERVPEGAKVVLLLGLSFVGLAAFRFAFSKTPRPRRRARWHAAYSNQDDRTGSDR